MPRADGWASRTSSRMPRRSASMPSACAASSTTASTPGASLVTRPARRAAGVEGTPAFFVNGVLHEGAFDAGSLVEALEAQAQ